MKKEIIEKSPIVLGVLSLILLPIIFLSATLAILATFFAFKSERKKSKTRLYEIIPGILSLVIILIYVIIYFAWGFPPILVADTCSMFHNEPNFEKWWETNKEWYESNEVSKSQIEESSIKNGISRGDLMIIKKETEYKIGDIIVFSDATTKDPLVNRVISENPYQTKGDNNPRQLTKENNQGGIDETNIEEENIIGKVSLKVPFVGRTKTMFRGCSY